MSDFYLLDRALTLAMKMYQKLQPEVEGIDGWQSVEEAYSAGARVNLYLRERGKLMSFCHVYIALSEVELEKKTLSIEIIGILEGHEFSDQKFTDTLSEYVMKQYQTLQPLVKESLYHRFGEQGEPSRVASRGFEVKYRIEEELYPQREDGTYQFDEDASANSAIPYIKSLLDIHNRLYADELR